MGQAARQRLRNRREKLAALDSRPKRLYLLMTLLPELVLSISDHLDDDDLFHFSRTCYRASNLLAPMITGRLAVRTRFHSDAYSEVDSQSDDEQSQEESDEAPDPPTPPPKLSNGLSPLHLFAAERKAKALNRLLECYTLRYGVAETTAAANRPDSNSVTPLLSALVSLKVGLETRFDTVKVLLKHGAQAQPICCVEWSAKKESITCEDCLFSSPLTYAIALGDRNVVKHLLSQGDLDTGYVKHPRGMGPRTPLEAVVASRDLGMLQLVLAKGSFGDLFAEDSPIPVAYEVLKMRGVGKTVREAVGDEVFRRRPKFIRVQSSVPLDTLKMDSMKGKMKDCRREEGRIRAPDGAKVSDVAMHYELDPRWPFHPNQKGAQVERQNRQRMLREESEWWE